MGEPNVFQFYFLTTSLGFGFNFSWWGGCLEINFTIPLFGLQIHCAKTKDNNWF